MTKEELEKEAEEYSYKVEPFTEIGIFNPIEVYYITDIEDAYLAGAELRDKRIAELEAQIEKMKCCENCADYDGQDCDIDNENYCRCFTGDKNDDCYWRLKED